MKGSDDDEGMPSLVHDSSENSSGDEGKPRKGQPKKKKKKKKAPAPSSDEEGDSGPQTGGAYPRQNPFAQFSDREALRAVLATGGAFRETTRQPDDARGAASSSAASADDLAGMTARALKELIGSAGLSSDGCIDKADLVERARTARARLAEQQVRAERERQRREEQERARAAEAESRRRLQEEQAAREEEQRRREAEKRLAEEQSRMARLLSECDVHGRADLDHLTGKLDEARALLASAEASRTPPLSLPRLRDAVNKAEKRRLAGEDKVGAAERREAERQQAVAERSDLDAQMKQRSKSLKSLAAKGGTERLEAELASLVDRAAQLDAELGVGSALPPAVAAQLELARAHARREQEARARAEGELSQLGEELSKLAEEKRAMRERIGRKDQTIEEMRKEAQSDNRKLKKERLTRAEAEVTRLTAEIEGLSQQLATMAQVHAQQLEHARTHAAAAPAGAADSATWFMPTPPALPKPPEEANCVICDLPLNGSALSEEETPLGTEVWIGGGVLQFRRQGTSKEQIETLDVVWEGDPSSPTGQPAASRPPDMHGFIKVVADRVKFRVQLAPSLELALAQDDRLYGCSFENPRRVYKGSPLVPEYQYCGHGFHTWCIDGWKAKATTCPTCNRDLNTPPELPS